MSRVDEHGQRIVQRVGVSIPALWRARVAVAFVAGELERGAFLRGAFTACGASSLCVETARTKSTAVMSMVGRW
jgi:hypothetical protein